MTTLREAAQQALEAMEGELPDWRTPSQARAITALRDALAQEEQEQVKSDEQAIEDAIEAAYWHFDARKKGLNEWAFAPQSERDAFKSEARKLVKGYFPTRSQEAQQTKREMLAVANAFARGRQAALAQEEQEPVAMCRTWHKGGDQHAELLEWSDALEALPDGEHLLYTHPPRRESQALTKEEPTARFKCTVVDDQHPNGVPFEQWVNAPQQEQEPVRAESVTTPPCKGMNCGAIDGRSHSLECHAEHSAAIAGGRFVPLPRREWQSLKDAELRKAYLSVSGNEWCLGGMANAESFYEAIEAKLKEKNNG